MRCPRCGRTQTGQVGNHEWYCWLCCLEFHDTPGGWRLFEVDEEGGLVELAGEAPGQAVAAAEATGAVNPVLA